MLQDLRQLEEHHGQSELVLRMQFKRGLHPFYPPTVQLVRPRCRAPLLGALPSHPMLQVASWDPWRPQNDLIEQLRIFLQVRCLRRRCQAVCLTRDSESAEVSGGASCVPLTNIRLWNQLRHAVALRDAL